jgi:hypothetical protein
VKLFLVAKINAETAEAVNHHSWEFGGIFDSRDLALAACRDWRYCICAVTLNETSPEETAEFPECEFPNLSPIETVTGGIQ